MKKDLMDFVSKCRICQQINYLTTKPAGLLQPINPHTRAWKDISIDFVVGLPPALGNIVTIVTVFLKSVPLWYAT